MQKQQKQIIKNNYEFQEIINKGKTIKNPSFVIYFRENETKFKYGISVGKKNGNAVLRNKIKRQIRMMIQEEIESGFDKKNDVIFIVRKNYLDKSFSSNQVQIRKIINNLK